MAVQNADSGKQNLDTLSPNPSPAVRERGAGHRGYNRR